MADPKGKRLLVIAGMAPKGAPSDDDEDDAPPDAKADDDMPPSAAEVDAAADAMAAAKAGDNEGFARALGKLIDAHAEA